MKQQSNPPASNIDYFIKDERSPVGTRSIVNYAERVPIPIVHEVMPHVTKRGSPNRNGDARQMNPQTDSGIPESPYQNEDPRTEMGMRITNNPQTDLGIPKPIWGSIHPHTKTGIPESVWGLFRH